MFIGFFLAICSFQQKITKMTLSGETTVPRGIKELGGTGIATTPILMVYT